MLPTSLADAIGALEKDTFYREAFGDTLVDYLLQMKESETAGTRPRSRRARRPTAQDVSDWEMREYFEFY